MSKNNNFFQADRQTAAVLKHGILARYLATYVGKVGSTSVDHRVGYIDGFAGSGVYSNPVTGRQTPGSPAIALQIASKTSGRTLETVFIEKNEKQLASLRSVVSQFKDPNAQVMFGDVRTQLPIAMKRFSDIPLLVFLDPFGTALEIESVIEILTRTGSPATEVLLNFSVESVRRIGGRLFEKETAKGRDASLHRLDDWLGGPWWRDDFVDTSLDGVEHRIAIAADRVFRKYVAKVNVGAGSSSFVVPVRRQPHHRPIFYLTLFFQRSFAVMPFNEAVSLATQDWRHHLHDLDLTYADLVEYRNPPLPGLSRVDELLQVFEDDETAFKVGTIDAISETIRKSLAERPSVSVTTDFQRVFGGTMGAGRTLHLRAAWKALAAEGVTNEVPTGSLDRAVIKRVSASIFG